MSEKIEHEYTDEPVCPHCGHVHRDSFEWEEDEGTQECEQCGKAFVYTRVVTVDWCTSKAEE